MTFIRPPGEVVYDKFAFTSLLEAFRAFVIHGTKKNQQVNAARRLPAQNPLNGFFRGKVLKLEEYTAGCFG